MSSSIKDELDRLSRQAENLTNDLTTLREMVTDDPEEPTDGKKLIFINDMARILDVSEATIRRYIRYGKLKPYRLGKKPYWLREELPKILKSFRGN